ncbi:hypothetical protein SAMN05216411_11913 [Nitrosospira multiformis]|nr:hypothetical protein SAMN05216411_11913 [Nitrosospira multiformis]
MVVGYLRPKIAVVVADVHVDTPGSKTIGITTRLGHMLGPDAILGQAA